LQHEITELLPLEVMLPAPGQGALALETLAGHWVDTVLAPLHDPPTASAVAAERAFLAHLGGGCMVPIAALGQCQAEVLHLQGLVSTPEAVASGAKRFGVRRRMPCSSGNAWQNSVVPVGRVPYWKPCRTGARPQ
jgi:porphobilinogen deaminase